MGAIVRWGVIILVVLAAVLSFLWFRAMSNAGEFTTLVPRFDGTCEPLEGYVGAEDFAFDAENRIVYAAAQDRRALWREGEEVRGAIYAINLDDPGRSPVRDLTGGVPEAFHAHGIDLFIDEAGVRRVFAVNHTHDHDEVLIYRVEPGGLFTLERTVVDPNIHHINDLAATGPDSFYYSIDKETETGSTQELIEGVLQIASGKVGYFDGESARVVATGLNYANGLAVSHDGGTLYVAETVGRRIDVFDRDPATNDVTLRERNFVGTGVDNIYQDPDGRLFIGAHPKLLTFAMGHAVDPEKRAPSQVIVIDPENVDGADVDVDQVFLSLGDDIAGSATGFVDVASGKMLIGPVYDPHILYCQLPEVWRHSEAHPASRPLLDEPDE